MIPMSDNKPYRPSNSDEGFWFISKFCENCIHGKYEHTMDLNDKPCEILSRSMFGQANEFVYDQDNKPSCTAFRKFQWEQNENGEWNEAPPPLDPNQLNLF